MPTTTNKSSPRLQETSRLTFPVHRQLGATYCDPRPSPLQPSPLRQAPPAPPAEVKSYILGCRATTHYLKPPAEPAPPPARIEKGARFTSIEAQRKPPALDLVSKPRAPSNVPPLIATNGSLPPIRRTIGRSVCIERGVAISLRAAPLPSDSVSPYLVHVPISVSSIYRDRTSPKLAPALPVANPGDPWTAFDVMIDPLLIPEERRPNFIPFPHCIGQEHSSLPSPALNPIGDLLKLSSSTPKNSEASSLTSAEDSTATKDKGWLPYNLMAALDFSVPAVLEEGQVEGLPFVFQFVPLLKRAYEVVGGTTRLAQELAMVLCRKKGGVYTQAVSPAVQLRRSYLVYETIALGLLAQQGEAGQNASLARPVTCSGSFLNPAVVRQWPLYTDTNPDFALEYLANFLDQTRTILVCRLLKAVGGGDQYIGHLPHITKVIELMLTLTSEHCRASLGYFLVASKVFSQLFAAMRKEEPSISDLLLVLLCGSPAFLTQRSMDVLERQNFSCPFVRTAEKSARRGSTSKASVSDSEIAFFYEEAESDLDTSRDSRTDTSASGLGFFAFLSASVQYELLRMSGKSTTSRPRRRTRHPCRLLTDLRQRRQTPPTGLHLKRARTSISMSIIDSIAPFSWRMAPPVVFESRPPLRRKKKKDCPAFSEEPRVSTVFTALSQPDVLAVTSLSPSPHTHACVVCGLVAVPAASSGHVFPPNCSMCQKKMAETRQANAKMKGLNLRRVAQTLPPPKRPLSSDRERSSRKRSLRAGGGSPSVLERFHTRQQSRGSSSQKRVIDIRKESPIKASKPSNKALTPLEARSARFFSAKRPRPLTQKNELLMASKTSRLQKKLPLAPQLQKLHAECANERSSGSSSDGTAALLVPPGADQLRCAIGDEKPDDAALRVAGALLVGESDLSLQQLPSPEEAALPLELSGDLVSSTPPSSDRGWMGIQNEEIGLSESSTLPEGEPLAGDVRETATTVLDLPDPLLIVSNAESGGSSLLPMGRSLPTIFDEWAETERFFIHTPRERRSSMPANLPSRIPLESAQILDENVKDPQDRQKYNPSNPPESLKSADALLSMDCAQANDHLLKEKVESESNQCDPRASVPSLSAPDISTASAISPPVSKEELLFGLTIPLEAADARQDADDPTKCTESADESSRISTDLPEVVSHSHSESCAAAAWKQSEKGELQDPLSAIENDEVKCQRLSLPENCNEGVQSDDHCTDLDEEDRLSLAALSICSTTHHPDAESPLVSAEEDEEEGGHTDEVDHDSELVDAGLQPRLRSPQMSNSTIANEQTSESGLMVSSHQLESFGKLDSLHAAAVHNDPDNDIEAQGRSEKALDQSQSGERSSSVSCFFKIPRDCREGSCDQDSDVDEELWRDDKPSLRSRQAEAKGCQFQAEVALDAERIAAFKTYADECRRRGGLRNMTKSLNFSPGCRRSLYAESQHRGITESRLQILSSREEHNDNAEELALLYARARLLLFQKGERGFVMLPDQSFADLNLIRLYRQRFEAMAALASLLHSRRRPLPLPPSMTETSTSPAPKGEQPQTELWQVNALAQGLQRQEDEGFATPLDNGSLCVQEPSSPRVAADIATVLETEVFDSELKPTTTEGYVAPLPSPRDSEKSHNRDTERLDYENARADGETSYGQRQMTKSNVTLGSKGVAEETQQEDSSRTESVVDGPVPADDPAILLVAHPYLLLVSETTEETLSNETLIDSKCVKETVESSLECYGDLGDISAEPPLIAEEGQESMTLPKRTLTNSDKDTAELSDETLGSGDDVANSPRERARSSSETRGSLSASSGEGDDFEEALASLKLMYPEAGLSEVENVTGATDSEAAERKARLCDDLVQPGADVSVSKEPLPVSSRDDVQAFPYPGHQGESVSQPSSGFALDDLFDVFPEKGLASKDGDLCPQIVDDSLCPPGGILAESAHPVFLDELPLLEDAFSLSSHRLSKSGVMTDEESNFTSLADTSDQLEEMQDEDQDMYTSSSEEWAPPEPVKRTGLKLSRRKVIQRLPPRLGARRQRRGDQLAVSDSKLSEMLSFLRRLLEGSIQSVSSQKAAVVTTVESPSVTRHPHCRFLQRLLLGSNLLVVLSEALPPPTVTSPFRLKRSTPVRSPPRPRLPAKVEACPDWRVPIHLTLFSLEAIEVVSSHINKSPSSFVGYSWRLHGILLRMVVPLQVLAESVAVRLLSPREAKRRNGNSILWFDQTYQRKHSIQKVLSLCLAIILDTITDSTARTFESLAPPFWNTVALLLIHPNAPDSAKVKSSTILKQLLRFAPRQPLLTALVSTDLLARLVMHLWYLMAGGASLVERDKSLGPLLDFGGYLAETIAEHEKANVNREADGVMEELKQLLAGNSYWQEIQPYLISNVNSRLSHPVDVVPLEHTKRLRDFRKLEEKSARQKKAGGVLGEQGFELGPEGYTLSSTWQQTEDLLVPCPAQQPLATSNWTPAPAPLCNGLKPSPLKPAPTNLRRHPINSVRRCVATLLSRPTGSSPATPSNSSIASSLLHAALRTVKHQIPSPDFS